MSDVYKQLCECLELICQASTYIKGCPWSLFVIYREKDKGLIKNCRTSPNRVTTLLQNPDSVTENLGRLMRLYRRQKVNLCVPQGNIEWFVNCTENCLSPLPLKVKQQVGVSEQPFSLSRSLCESEKLSVGGKKTKLLNFN